MAVELIQGQSSGPNDLKINFTITDAGNNSVAEVDPVGVNYTLIDCTSGQDLAIGMPNRLPVKLSTGKFYAPWTIPLDEPVGLHKIRWTYKLNKDSQYASNEQIFYVRQLVIPSEIPEYSDCEVTAINELRMKLRDINPDRDYSFSPPQAEKELAGFTRIRGARWPNDILLCHLYNAADWLNSTRPPFTEFTLCEIINGRGKRHIGGLRPLLLLQASVFAMLDLATLWINEEFDYSLNGVSLSISRYDKYSSLASQLQDMINNQLEVYKSGIKYTKGLAQSRYTYGRGAAYGPWVSGTANVKSWIGSFKAGYTPKPGIYK